MVAFLRSAGHSYPLIAKMMRRKDHTSAIYQVRKAEELWGDDVRFRALMARAQVQDGGAEIHRPSVELIDDIGMNNLDRAVAGEWP